MYFEFGEKQCTVRLIEGVKDFHAGGLKVPHIVSGYETLILTLRMFSGRRWAVESGPLCGQAARCFTSPAFAAGRIRRSRIRSKSSSSAVTSKSSPGCILQLVRMALGSTNCPRWPILIVIKYDYHTFIHAQKA